MNLLRWVRSGALVTIVALVALPSFGTIASLNGCGESPACSRLRDTTYAQKETWDACDPAAPEPCVAVFGNPKDCTGVLACEFAVNPIHRAEAEMAVLTIGQQSQGCYLCAIPDCVMGAIPWCEPVSRRCMIITSLLEGGAPTFEEQPPTLEASAPAPVDANASAPVPDASGSDASGI
jgi:hypothetical protein